MSEVSKQPQAAPLPNPSHKGRGYTLSPPWERAGVRGALKTPSS